MHVINNIVSISCCCGARASHTLSTHTTQHLILRLFHIIDFVNTCVHRQSPPVVLHSQPHGTLVRQKCQKSSRHLDTVQFSCPSSALVTLVHCDGHSRFITVSKSLYDFGHLFFQHLCQTIFLAPLFFRLHARSLSSL